MTGLRRQKGWTSNPSQGSDGEEEGEGGCHKAGEESRRRRPMRKEEKRWS